MMHMTGTLCLLHLIDLECKYASVSDRRFALRAADETGASSGLELGRLRPAKAEEAQAPPRAARFQRRERRPEAGFEREHRGREAREHEEVQFERVPGRKVPDGLHDLKATRHIRIRPCEVNRSDGDLSRKADLFVCDDTQKSFSSVASCETL